ncbi:MAG: TIM barrel protein [Planctomycetota bacterium]
MRIVVAAASSALATLSAASARGEGASQPNFRICAFEKFLQDLSYDELADVVAELGFVGIEATVRQRGHVAPERVEEDLPKLVAALAARGLEITVMASDVVRIDDPINQRVLQTASDLGVTRYRMGYYRYDDEAPIPQQLEEFKPMVRDLAQANQELGLTALYQNHAGARNVGATVWDLYELIKDVPTDQIAVAFDIRHAAVEAGLAWPITYRLIQPHIGALFVKDFVWRDGKVENVPLGDGLVDPKFFASARRRHRDLPISLHVEYLTTAGVQPNIDALRKDLGVLRRWLSA